MKLVRLRNSVVINILPETKRREDRISTVYLTIPVAAVRLFIVFGEGEEAISFFRGAGLLGEITEQFGAVIDLPVAITAQGQPCIIRAGGRPGQTVGGAAAAQIKNYAVCRVCHLESIATYVYHY